MNKTVILLVDNRKIEQEIDESDKNIFKGSAFKATEFDPQDQSDMLLENSMDFTMLQELRQKIICLESRVCDLEIGNSKNGMNRRVRRKANEMNRDFRCDEKDCGKLYGSDTSLKKHIKMKHRNRK